MSPIEMSNETKTKGRLRENQKQFAHLFRTPTLILLRAAAHKKGVMKKRFTIAAVRGAHKLKRIF